MGRSHSEGFTMIELLIVVAILALVVTGSVFSFAPLVSTLRDRQALGTVGNLIREAQIRALRESRPYRVCFESDVSVSLYYGVEGASLNDYSQPNQWHSVQVAEFPRGVSVYRNAVSWPCITYSGTGSPAWPSPRVDRDPTRTTSPYWGAAALPRLLDGAVSTTPPDPYDPLSPSIINDPNVISWTGIPPDGKAKVRIPIVSDSVQARYFQTVGIRVISCSSRPKCKAVAKYPTAISVRASTLASPSQESDWTPAVNVLVSTQLTEPADGSWKPGWVIVPLSGSYRSLEVTLTSAGSALVVDEADIRDFIVPVKGSSGNWNIVVSSVSGKVLTKKITP